MLQLHVYAIHHGFRRVQPVLLLVTSDHFPRQRLRILDISLVRKLLELRPRLAQRRIQLPNLAVKHPRLLLELRLPRLHSFFWRRTVDQLADTREGHRCCNLGIDAS